MTAETLPEPLVLDATDLTAAWERAHEYVQAATAANTRRAYAADWRDFAGWCEQHGYEPLSASPEGLALYLSDRAARLSTSTLSRRLAAIRAAYRAAEVPWPGSSVLDRIWSGIRRTHARPATGKSPLTVEQLRVAVQMLPANSAGLRDRAMLLVGFGAALRRSELAALEIDRPGAGPVRVRIVGEGLEVRVDRSKADQEGAGAVIAVPNGATSLTCPTRALTEWLLKAGIAEGRVFRRVDRWGHIGLAGITDQTVAHVVKAAAGRIGIDPRLVSGHSLRSGLATSAAANDAPAQVIMDHMRHARFETTRRYIREADRFRRNAAKVAGL